MGKIGINRADQSVDAVFIDGLHNYQGVKDDIAAWKPKLNTGDSLIFNDYNIVNMFPGIKKAVKEEAKKQRTKVRFVDKTNAVIGGSAKCATFQPSRRRWWKFWT